MNCSGEKVGDWCHDLPTHYVGSNGSSYCLFHTPKGHKKVVSGNEFNNIVFENIEADLTEIKSCNFSGTVFDWDINFKYLQTNELTGDIDFSNVNFFGDVNIRSKVFAGHVDFSGSIFHQKSDFDNSNFLGPCNFKNAIFKEQPCFFDTIFDEKVDFTGVNFHKGAFFTWGALRKGANFTDAVYGAKLVFKRAIPE